MAISSFIKQETDYFIVVWRGKKNEVTETKSFELLRKTELHQFEVLLIPHLALSDDETKPRVP